MDKPVIMITGASSGIGAACAKAFSNAGYSLLLLARRLEPMSDLKLPKTLCKSVDVTDFEQVKAAVNEATEKLGSIDCLINNAGVLIKGHFSETDINNETDMVNININGVINSAKAVIAGMQQRKQGTIINLSSIADRVHGVTFAMVYAATKAAVKSFSQSLSLQYKDDNIRCCNIAPAYIETPMWDTIESPSHEGTGLTMISAEKLAETILWMYQQSQELCIRDMVITPTKSPI